MFSRTQNPILSLIAAVLGGLLAGALIGLLETLYLYLSSGDLRSLSALWFGIATYGVLGAGLALIWGITRLPRKTSAQINWQDSLTAIMALLLFSIILFRVRRDLLQESVGWKEPLGLLLMVVTLIGILATYYILRRIVRRIFGSNRKGYVLPSTVIILVLAIVGWALQSLNPQGVGPVNWLPANWSESTDSPPNILLIIVDTLRDDFLTDGSPHRIETPNIDALSASGIRFSDCMVQASKTRPSVASILTSLYPSTHGAERKIHGLSPTVPHFPEILGQYGYSTVALVNNINLTPFFGFDRGFGVYRYLAPSHYFGANDAASNLVVYGTLRKLVEKITAGIYRVNHYYWDAESVADLTIQWLDSAPSEPFFLWTYFMDPHDPYFDHPYNGNATARVTTPNPPAADLPLILDRYRAEISHMDQQVGRILTALEKSGKSENTIVIFTADHGEEFLEHGGWWHGTTLYREVLDVPLIVRVPKSELNGTVRHDPVMGVDVGPTVLDLCEIPIPDSWEGQSLFAAEFEPNRLRFAEVDHEGNQVKALSDGNWIWMEANPGNPRGLPETALYDLKNDPQELINLADRSPQIAQDMGDILHGIVNRALEKKGTIPQITIDRATEERLRALGYTK